MFFMFLLKFKKHVFMFFFKNFFLCFSMYFFNVVFLLLLKQKRTKLQMMHFSWTKTPFPGQSECFVAVLLTLFDSY